METKRLPEKLVRELITMFERGDRIDYEEIAQMEGVPIHEVYAATAGVWPYKNIFMDIEIDKAERKRSTKNKIFVVFMLGIITFLLAIFAFVGFINDAHANTWTNETYRKVDACESLWYQRNTCVAVMDVCKTTQNPEGCFYYGIAIPMHETAKGTKGVGYTHNNLYGLKQWGQFMYFDTHFASFERWVQSYDKFWYRNYTPYQWVYRSNYTMTQKPEWIRNVQFYIDKLDQYGK